MAFITQRTTVIVLFVLRHILPLLIAGLQGVLHYDPRPAYQPVDPAPS